jgi:hypothetical protein
MVSIILTFRWSPPDLTLHPIGMNRTAPSTSRRVFVTLKALAMFLTLLHGFAATVAAQGGEAGAQPPRLGNPNRNRKGNGNDALASSSLVRSTGQTTRQLQMGVGGFREDITNADLSAGNPVGSCGVDSAARCINGCPSQFYKLIVNATDQYTGFTVFVSTCEINIFSSRTYIWKGGANSACDSFTCVGKEVTTYGYCWHVATCCNDLTRLLRTSSF